MARKSKNPLNDMAAPPDGSQLELPWLEGIWGYLIRFQRFGKDVAGVFILAIASITLLALIGLTSGQWLNPWAALLRRWLGWGSIFVVLGLAIAGLIMLRRQDERFSIQDWGRVIALEFAAFSILALLSLIGGSDLAQAEAGRFGGLVGWSLAYFLELILPTAFGAVFRVILLVLFIIIGILFGFNLVGKAMRALEERLAPKTPEVLSEQPAVSVGEAIGTKSPSSGEQKKKKNRVVLPPEFRKDFKVDDPQNDQLLEAAPRDEDLPGLDLLLSEKGSKPNERHINQTAGLIEKTLSEFGIPANVVGFKVGPTITQFAIEPGYIKKNGSGDAEKQQKVRVSQISALRKDLALALSVERLRIQAPVPGRSYVGIEVPNEKMTLVRLRPLLESEDFYKAKSPLTLALGRDVSGFPVIADLVKMPHLLIAGTTGSGKSVSIAAMTVCLAMNNSPEDLKMVMIDPKMVELVRFNGLPHLLGKVETDLERIGAVLRWTVVEMQNRYKLLEELKSRDIESYNRKVRRRKDFNHLPRIVVMIDELADLMINAGEVTEATVVRLAQMARAVGIHLVIATQRPSTDVVTGLIKANFPARLSFNVASGIDSRVILDMPGAESLLGRGDMLFLSPESGIPVRTQGVLVTDKEIERLITYWQKARADFEQKDSPWESLMVQEAQLADKDVLIEKAIEIVRKSERASTSMLQRQLRIGYPRAARLMDDLEDLGVVGTSKGGGRERDILPEYDDSEGQE